MRRLNREVNDGQPNHQHVIENGKDTVAVDNTSAPRKGRSRKAANLAELQRYFTAAADAAAEVGLDTAPSPDALHACAPSTAQASATTAAAPAVVLVPSGASAAGLARPPLAPPTAAAARVPAPGAAIESAGTSAASALVAGAHPASLPAAASAHGKARAVVKSEPEAMDAATADQFAQAGVKPVDSPRCDGRARASGCPRHPLK